MTRSSNVDEFLIRLVGDISAIKTTVSSLESQLEKYEEKLLGPFQDLTHAVKTLETESQRLSQELKKLRDDDIATLKKDDHEHKEGITAINEKINTAKWYVAGGLAVGTAVFAVIYKIASFFIGIYFH
jgi:predicted  nucleic acid-binding Zn-ribbon protein